MVCNNNGRNRKMSHTAYCVYLVTCEVTGKQYVGCTSVKLKYRMSSHRLGGPMAEDIETFGMDRFVVESIEVFSDKEAALAEEARQIRTRGTHEPDGYNGQVRGGKYPGRGGAVAGNKNSRRRRIEGIKGDGSIVYTFPTVSDASSALGVSRGQIQRALKIPRYTAGGLFWKSAGVAEHGG